MKIVTKEFYAVLFICILNGFIYFLLLPYVQQTANSHLNAGPFYGTISYLLSIISLVTGLSISVKYKSVKFLLFFFLLSGTFCYWGYKLCSLYCEGCMNSG
ncbi:MAG: hypothetical protein JWM14_1483 [Chitinophagaceae bacterium]|nr:hypothetical protein [Chitinophagaceae bacterium]